MAQTITIFARDCKPFQIYGFKKMTSAAIFREAKKPSRKTSVSKIITTNLPISQAIIPISKKAPTFQAPLGGFRQPTVRDQRVLAEIKAAPNLTAREYGDRLSMISGAVNDCILFTREGRSLAEQGMVSLPTASRPRWASLIVNRYLLTTRRRENQFGAISFNRNRLIKGENRTSLEILGEIFQKLHLTTSPKAVKELHTEFQAAILVTGRARGREQAKLASCAANPTA